MPSSSEDLELLIPSLPSHTPRCHPEPRSELAAYPPTKMGGMEVTLWGPCLQDTRSGHWSLSLFDIRSHRGQWLKTKTTEEKQPRLAMNLLSWCPSRSANHCLTISARQHFPESSCFPRHCPAEYCLLCVRSRQFWSTLPPTDNSTRRVAPPLLLCQPRTSASVPCYV